MSADLTDTTARSSARPATATSAATANFAAARSGGGRAAVLMLSHVPVAEPFFAQLDGVRGVFFARLEAQTGRARKKDLGALKDADAVDSAAYAARHSLDGVLPSQVDEARRARGALGDRFEHVAAAVCVVCGLPPAEGAEQHPYSEAFAARVDEAFVASLRRLSLTSVTRRQAHAAAAHLRLVPHSSTILPHSTLLASIVDWLRGVVVSAAVHYSWDRASTDPDPASMKLKLRRTPARAAF